MPVGSPGVRDVSSELFRYHCPTPFCPSVPILRKPHSLYITIRARFEDGCMSDSRSATDASRRCERCGAAVSKQFVRVFGVGNTVHGCLDCLTRKELAGGEAAARDETVGVEITTEGVSDRSR